MIIKDFYQSRYKSRWFFFFLIMTAVLLILGNYLVLPFYLESNFNVIDTVTAFLNNLIALVLSVLVASIAVIFFSPKVIKNSDIEIIHPKDLKSELERIANDTDIYYYMGHTARWNRSVTLEKLRINSELKRTRTEVSLLILNPNNKDLCKYYSNFGHSNRKNGFKVKTGLDVKVELIITILVCAKYNSNPLLQISIHLLDKASLFRLDISDEGIVFTKPYQEEPALLFPKNTFFYDSYKEEFKIAREQCDNITLEALPINLDINNCRDYLESLSVDLYDIDNDRMKIIIESVKNPVKPY